MTEPQPLSGLTIVVTRARAQAASMVARLESLGAEVHTVPVIEIAAPADGGAALSNAVARLDEYDWIALTSMNGARSMLAALDAADVAACPPIACVGPGTARFVSEAGRPVSLVPDRAVGEGLVEAMPSGPGRVLLPQAEVAREVVERGLGAKGWDVDRVIAYRTLDADIRRDAAELGRSADLITFTSSSTVERWLRLVGPDALPPVVASIGPITTATAQELGVEVTVAAEQHSVDGLVDAIVAWAVSR